MAGYEDGDKPASRGVTGSGDACATFRDMHLHAEAAKPRDEDGTRAGFGGAAGVQVGLGNVQVNNYFYGDRTRSVGDGALSMPTSGPAAGSPRRGHAFISYVREDSGEVDDLQRILEASGIPVWRNRPAFGRVRTGVP